MDGASIITKNETNDNPALNIATSMMTLKHRDRIIRTKLFKILIGYLKNSMIVYYIFFVSISL